MCQGVFSIKRRYKMGRKKSSKLLNPLREF